MKLFNADYITQSWYQSAPWLYLLFPLYLVYAFVIYCRKTLYRFNLFTSYRSPLPVIIVGNITVGGTGKSPLVTYLVESLQALGYQPGVVSRGYGAALERTQVKEVFANSTALEVGDEPLMLKRRLNCPIFVSPSRRLAVQALMKSGCDIVIADDGLQHYALARDIEICVFDGQRGWGNGYLLPMGPLREPKSRVNSCDFIVVNGQNTRHDYRLNKAFQMDLQREDLINLHSHDSKSMVEFSGQTVNAVAAIGNPERFFASLESQGLKIERHAFDDHHHYQKGNFEFSNAYPIIMTEKDAVKCHHLHLDQAWYMPVSAKLSADLAGEIVKKLKSKGSLNG